MAIHTLGQADANAEIVMLRDQVERLADEILALHAGVRAVADATLKLEIGMIPDSGALAEDIERLYNNEQDALEALYAIVNEYHEGGAPDGES